MRPGATREIVAAGLLLTGFIGAAPLVGGREVASKENEPVTSAPVAVSPRSGRRIEAPGAATATAGAEPGAREVPILYFEPRRGDAMSAGRVVATIRPLNKTLAYCISWVYMLQNIMNSI